MIRLPMLRRRGTQAATGVMVAIILAIVGARSATAEAADTGPHLWDAADGVWVAKHSTALSDLKRRYPNATFDGCWPEDGSASLTVGTVQYWNNWWCGGSTRTSPKRDWNLNYIVIGKCADCFKVSGLIGASETALGKAASPPPPPKPKKTLPVPRGDWWWSEASATSTLSHSQWVFSHHIDRYSVDCAGFGRSWHPKNSPILYQRFNCTMDDSVIDVLSYLYRLTVVGKNKFVMTRLATNVSLGG
jgi:hypothetical protein